MNKTAALWRKDVLGWSLYDFANTIFSMNIISLYLKRYIVEDLGYDDRYYDIPYAVSMIFAAALLPALGAVSDYSTKKKLFVFLFTITCCAATGLLSLVPGSFVIGTILLFVIANFAYEAAQPFYNALLYSVAAGRQARFVSGFGVAFGYIGSVVGMAVVLPFVTGDLFGIEIPFIEGGGKEAAFLPTALLFILFSIPLFTFVREAPVQKAGQITMRQGYREVVTSLKQTKKYPGVLRFLVSDYFFEDAVTTVIINIGLYCSIVLGMAEAEITFFLIISTISAVVGSFVLGFIARRWHLKPLLALIVGGWVVALLVFVFAESMTIIWILGSMVGILLGGLWTTSRPMLGELVPRDELGRFFGLFSLSGRAAAIVGPLVWTAVVYLFNAERTLGRFVVELLAVSPDNYHVVPYKIAVLSLAVMMLVGLFLFRKVPQARYHDDG